MADILVYGLTPNNLKHVTFRIPKEKSRCSPAYPAPASPVSCSIPSLPKCGGVRYNEEALACTYKGKNVVELLGLTASQALELFEDAKIKKHLKVMEQVGLSYLTLGQPLSIPPF